MSKNLNIKSISTDKKKFYILWLTFLKPYHKLANKEIEFLATLLYKRSEIRVSISDDNMVDEMLFNKSIKEEIRIEMGYKNMQVYNNMLRFLRKKNVLVKNKIIKGLIPELSGNNYQLIFNFNINEK